MIVVIVIKQQVQNTVHKQSPILPQLEVIGSRLGKKKQMFSLALHNWYTSAVFLLGLFLLFYEIV